MNLHAYRVNDQLHLEPVPVDEIHLETAAENRPLWVDVLTVVQAVFVPLTLIAGIYGMSFEGMPELEWPYAYFACLGLMLFVGGGAMWKFNRRGWFE